MHQMSTSPQGKRKDRRRKTSKHPPGKSSPKKQAKIKQNKNKNKNKNENKTKQIKNRLQQ